MSGRGGVVNNTWDGVMPPECRPDPLIKWLSAALRWQEAREPLHIDIDVYAVCRGGGRLGMAFANVVRRGLGCSGRRRRWAGAVCRGEHQDRAVGQGDATIRADGAEGQGSGCGWVGGQHRVGAVVPGRERHHLTVGCRGVQGQDGEDGRGPARQSRLPTLLVIQSKVASF